MENVVDDKTHLLLKANKYKKFARWIGDSETVQRVLALAEELKQRARAMVRPHEEIIRQAGPGNLGGEWTSGWKG
jgi:hypothetical protein